MLRSSWLTELKKSDVYSVHRFQKLGGNTMMYSQGFIVSVKNEKGEVLRESRGREVFLPFDSEYSLLLKNNNSRSCVAEVLIDGTKVLGEHQLIIGAHTGVDLRRFCLDGDLDSGRKFRFVHVDDPRVQDPMSYENGMIEVKFWLEKQISQSIKNLYRTRSKGSPCKSFGFGPDEICRRFEEVGATVEGSVSGQSFNVGHLGELERTYTTIRLFMKPYKEIITVKSSRTIFCSACGRKNKTFDNFCSKCGKRLASFI